MKELGITKGEWVISPDNNWELCILMGDQEDHYINLENRDIDGWDEMHANAELICDAGNTAQKSGLLPSELLRQRDELREALVDMVWQFAYTCSEGYHTGGLSALEGAFGALGLSDPITILDFEAAIKSTEPKKPIEDCGYWETYGYCIPGCGTDSCKRHPLNR